MNEPLAITAIISKISTLVDGSIRLSFDIGADSSESISNLFKLRGMALYLVIMDEETMAKNNHPKTGKK